MSRFAIVLVLGAFASTFSAFAQQEAPVPVQINRDELVMISVKGEISPQFLLPLGQSQLGLADSDRQSRQACD